MSESEKPARNPVDYNYNQLHWGFINAMARIGHLGAAKYGEGSWRKKTLTGDASATNHIAEHFKGVHDQ